jgi:hypothetical protein
MDDGFEDILDRKGQVRRERVEDLLLEVSTGKHVFVATREPHDLFVSRCPTASEQAEAQAVYVRAAHDYRRRGLRSRADLETFAIQTGQLDPAERAEKDNLTVMLAKLTKTREQSQDPNQKLQLDTQVFDVHGRIAEIDAVEHQVLRHSAESRAEEVRVNYYVARCTLGGEMFDTPVWRDWHEFLDSTDRWMIHDARKAYLRVSQGLPIRIIRAISRTPEWRARWRSVKESNSALFDGSAVSWDRNKLNIIYWSDFYDTVYQHPECPPEEVVANDDLLQQWLSQQVANRKRPAAGHTPAGPTPTRGGKPMVKIGESHRSIKTPYRMPVRT